MKKTIADLTIDLLLTDARVRLAFERQRKGQAQAAADHYTIHFLPLAAAAGGEMPPETSCFSEDHNFVARYNGVENLYCEVQAKGYAAINMVQGRDIAICYDKRYFFRAHFNEKGVARFELPEKTPDDRYWQTLSFSLGT